MHEEHQSPNPGGASKPGDQPVDSEQNFGVNRLARSFARKAHATTLPSCHELLEPLHDVRIERGLQTTEHLLPTVSSFRVRPIQEVTYRRIFVQFPHAYAINITLNAYWLASVPVADDDTMLVHTLRPPVCGRSQQWCHHCQ